MNIDETIKKRRSIRKYKKTKIGSKEIRSIIEVGKMAPSGMNKQPWEFIVIDKRELIKELSSTLFKDIVKKNPNAKKRLEWTDDPVFYNAPLVILMMRHSDNIWASLDSGMAAQNMMLKATSLGIGSCPIGSVVGLINENSDLLRKINAPPECIMEIALIFGHADEHPEMKPRREGNVHFV